MIKVLIIYTGGTFGMQLDSDGVLVPFGLDDLHESIPELSLLNAELKVVNAPEILDSSSVGPKQWLDFNGIIQSNYNNYDAFIVLHGTDTMSYSASALSFLLKGITKPVLFTGAQIPIGEARNDARDNLLGAVDLLVKSKEKNVNIPEVCVYFDNKLIRGNRSVKIESDGFAAFHSHNYPELCVLGIEINFFERRILKSSEKHFCDRLDTRVGVLTFFPGIMSDDVSPFFDLDRHKIVIVQSYGSGNFPINEDLKNTIKTYLDKGGLVLNVSQCIGGMVVQKKYELGNKLQKLGVLGMSDITLEACVVKSMYALSNIQESDRENFLTTPFCGEMKAIERIA